MTGVAIVGAFVRRDWAIERSYRLAFIGTLVSSFVSLVMFFFIGRVVDNSSLASDATMKHGYFSFVIIGLILVEIITFTTHSFQTSLIDLQTTGTLEAMLATPPPSWLLIVAGPLYHFLWTAVTEMLVLAIAAAFFGVRFEVSPASALVAAIALAAIVVFFGALGLTLAGVTAVAKRGATQPVRFVMSGMVLLGAVYYPIDVLPSKLQIVARCLPLTWAIEVLRAALLNGTVLTGQFVLLVVVALVALPAGVAFFNAALDRARLAGSLTQY